jgi:2,3-bisphosphoglycerate-dependent phosphoglycerate mutase
LSKSLGPRDRGCDNLSQCCHKVCTETMPELVLMRHGATLWAQDNKFAGWGDTALSPAGLEDAKAAGRALKRSGLQFERVMTSRLLRASQTVSAVLGEMNCTDLTVHADWRLNERHYGALQGNTRSSMITQYGHADIVAWRRSFNALPPPLTDDDPRWLEQRERLPDVPPAAQPRSESMAMAATRAQSVWASDIAPHLQAGQRVLIVAHTSSIRGLSQIIHGLDDSAAENIRIATAIPRLYRFDDSLRLMHCEDIQSGAKSTLRMWVNRLKPKRLGFA